MLLDMIDFCKLTEHLHLQYLITYKSEIWKSLTPQFWNDVGSNWQSLNSDSHSNGLSPIIVTDNDKTLHNSAGFEATET